MMMSKGYCAFEHHTFFCLFVSIYSSVITITAVLLNGVLTKDRRLVVVAGVKGRCERRIHVSVKQEHENEVLCLDSNVTSSRQYEKSSSHTSVA